MKNTVLPGAQNLSGLCAFSASGIGYLHPQRFCHSQYRALVDNTYALEHQERNVKADMEPFKMH